nr:FtsX-like permease family protein [Streptomyces griseus]
MSSPPVALLHKEGRRLSGSQTVSRARQSASAAASAPHPGRRHSALTELRPDLVRLHRIGLSPGTLRRIVIWQSVTIGLVAAVLGGATGWGLAAARNWPGGIPVVMNWTAVATVLALTLVLSAAYGALAAPRHVGNTLNRTET